MWNFEAQIRKTGQSLQKWKRGQKECMNAGYPVLSIWFRLLGFLAKNQDISLFKGSVMKLKLMGWMLVFLLFSSAVAWAGLTKDQVSQLYVAIFNRASEGEGNAYWRSQPDMATAAIAMLDTQAAEDYFGDSLNTDQAFIEHIYFNTLNKTIADDFDGINYWVEMLDAGTSRGKVVVSLVGVIKDYAPDGPYYDPDDTATIAAFNQFTNRVTVSNYMADSVYTPPADWVKSTQFNITGLDVNDNAGSVAVAKRAVDRFKDVSSTTKDIFQRLENHFYPKLFVQIQGWVETDVYDEAAQRDIIIMDTIAMEFCPSYLGEYGVIRSINPNAIILMYFSAADIMVPGWTDVLKQFVAGVKDEWYMKDDQGETYPLFPNTSGWNYMFNPTTGVNAYMPEFINDNILVPGFSDGIFFDWIVESVSWLNERTDGVICGLIDIDNDGIGDSSYKIDKLWIEGIKKLLNHARTKFPNDSIITGNGGWVFDGTYRFTGLNGRMVEQFLKGYSHGWERFSWIEVMRGYYLMQEGAEYPRLPLVMTNGDQNDFKHMRYGLTSTLLFDGYSTYTDDQDWSGNAVPYTANWWYDEYSVDIETGKAIKSMANKGYLGSAISDAHNAADSDDLLLNSLVDYDPQTTEKIWRRDFQNGIVLVNPSTIDITIDLQDKFRKIIGIYDPVFNNGEILSKITMEGESGVVLLNCQ
jgi:hypothetical protein